jgi:nitrate reductase NapE component
MITRFRSARFQRAGRTSGVMDMRPSDVRGLSRLVQVALAVYLIPALLIVLVVGGCGMLILAVARALTTIVYGPAGSPRTRV